MDNFAGTSQVLFFFKKVEFTKSLRGLLDTCVNTSRDDVAEQMFKASVCEHANMAKIKWF